MKKISLKTIAAVIGADYSGEDCFVHAVCTDTRQIEPGALFIAIAGERFDAHHFIGEAEKKGAIACVCQKQVESTVPVPYVEDTRKAFLAIAGYYRSLFDIPLVGITGSVGKTTTKEFIALALSARYKTLKTEGNLNNDIGMPTTLLKLDSSYEAAVIEMGMNHFGEIHNLTLSSRPTMGVITNIGVSHIENLGSREGILKAKLEILDGMDAAAPLLLCADNDLLSSVNLPDRRCYYFGIHSSSADFNASEIVLEGEGTRFVITYEENAYPAYIPTVGEHNVLNALCAFGVGVLNGIDAAAVIQKLAAYVPAGRRQKTVDCGDFRVIEDCYNASPDSMRAAIGTLTQTGAPKTIAVLADMLELGDYGERMHREVGAFAAAQRVDVLLCYGDEARFYCEQALADGIGKARHFADKDSLLEAIIEEMEQGSVILFKGSHGMHLEEVIEKLYERKGIKNE